jgi:hypothetical protein
LPSYGIKGSILLEPRPSRPTITPPPLAASSYTATRHSIYGKSSRFDFSPSSTLLVLPPLHPSSHAPIDGRDAGAGTRGASIDKRGRVHVGGVGRGCDAGCVLSCLASPWSCSCSLRRASTQGGTIADDDARDAEDATICRCCWGWTRRSSRSGLANRHLENEALSLPLAMPFWDDADTSSSATPPPLDCSVTRFSIFYTHVTRFLKWQTIAR